MSNFTRKPPTTDFRAKPDEEYSPPLGSSIGANFTPLPPTTNFTRGEEEPKGDAQYVTGYGFESTKHSINTVVINWESHTKPAGIFSTVAYGGTTVYNLRQYADFDNRGVEPPALPTAHKVINLLQRVTLEGFTTTTVGEHDVFNTTADQVIYHPTLGDTATVIGTPSIGGSVITQGSDHLNIGTFRATYYHISVTFTDFLTITEPDVAVAVTPEGFLSERLGRFAELVHGTQYVNPLAIEPPALSEGHELFDPRQDVTDVTVGDTYESGDDGNVYNRLNFVAVGGSDYLKISNLLNIYNANRTVHHVSEQPMTEFGETLIDHTFHDVGVQGGEHFEYGDTSVWFKHRVVDFFSRGTSSTVVSDELKLHIHKVEPTIETVYMRSLTTSSLYGDTNVVNQIPMAESVTAGVLTIYGRATVDTSTQWVDMEGAEPTLDYGEPFVHSTIQVASPRGFDALTVSTRLTIYNLENHVRYTGIAASLYGQPRVARLGEQEILPDGISSAQYGRPTTSQSELILPRAVTPANKYGTPTLILRDVAITMDGYDATFYGQETRVEYVHRTVEMKGRNQAEYGDLSIFDPLQVLTDVGITDIGLIGDRTTVYNASYQITPHGEEYFESRHWHEVYNRNRMIRLIQPAPMTRYGLQAIHNLSSAVEMQGVDHSEYGDTAVWFSVRNVSFVSLGKTFTEYGDTGVRNWARQIIQSPERAFTEISRPTIFNRDNDVFMEGGASSVIYGRAELRNLADALYMVSLASTNKYGTAHLQNMSRYVGLEGIEAPKFPAVRDSEMWVSNHTRSLKLSGDQWGEYGKSEVINTTANQLMTDLTVGLLTEYGSPRFVNSLPYYVNVRGDDFARIGSPRLIPYNISVDFTDHLIVNEPSVGHRIRVEGLFSQLINEATYIDLKTKYVEFTGKVFTEFGTRTELADPTQFVERVGVVETGLMGDRNYVYNHKSFVTPRGVEHFISQQWHTVHSNKRSVTVRGAEQTRYGDNVVRNGSLGFTAHGRDQSQYGDINVWFAVRKLEFWQYGVNESGVGTAVIINVSKEVKPPSLDAGHIGVLSIENAERTLLLEGGHYNVFGSGVVDWGRRYITPASNHFDVYGAGHELTNEFRDIAVTSINPPPVGTPRIDYLTRGITTTGRVDTLYGYHDVIRLTQFIRPHGQVYTEYGTSISPVTRTAWVRGVSSPAIPYPDVTNRSRVIEMRPMGETKYGQLGSVFNSDSYIDLFDEGIEPQVTLRSIQSVIDGTLRIEPKWNVSLRFGTARYGLSGRALLLEGDDELTVGGARLVADAIRPVSVNSIGAPAIMRYTAVHNAAYLIAYDGMNDEAFGTAIVADPTQFTKPQFFDAGEYGRPWVSSSPRELVTYSFSQFFAPHPTVELGSREIYVDSVRGVSVPSHRTEVAEYRLDIILRNGIVSGGYGRFHEVVNVTPELTGVGGNDSFESGKAFIRTEWREVKMRGHEHFYAERPHVEFTLRYVLPRGELTFRSGNATAYNANPDPIVPSDHYISPVWKTAIEWGEWERNRYGRVTVRLSTIEDVTVKETLEIGRHVITQTRQLVDFYQGIVAPTLNDLNHEVTNRIRRVTIVEGMDYTIVPTAGGYGKSDSFRMTPHRIYCTNDYPEQVTESYSDVRKNWNDPFNTYYPWEFTTPHRNVGVPAIAHTVAPDAPQPQRVTLGDLLRWGDRTTVYNADSFIQPEGLYQHRLGWVMFYPHTIEVEMYGSVNHAVYGNSTVKHSDRPFDQTVPPKSIVSAGIGQHRVESFNRELTPLGTSYLLFGRPADRNSYAWNGFAVSPPRPTKMEGRASAVKYGEPWVSRSPRPLDMEGYYSFTTGYSVGSFDGRMRVTEVNRQERYPTQHISPSGIVSEQVVTVPDIQLMRYYIRPDGWTDMYIKGINGVTHG